MVKLDYGINIFYFSITILGKINFIAHEVLK